MAWQPVRRGFRLATQDAEHVDRSGRQKLLWLVAPQRKRAAAGTSPSAVLEFGLQSRSVGKAVRLVVRQNGQFAATIVEEREFADPKRAVAYVRDEVDRYRRQGWRLRFEPPT